MTSVSLQEALRIAVRHHQSGQFQQAEAIYRQILAASPEHADALHLMGVLAHQFGQHEQAVALIGKAIAVFPRSPEYHTNLGEALRALGRHDEALASYRRAIQVDPRFATAWNNLGIALKDQGRKDEAVSAFRRALTLQDDFFAAWNNLGIVLKELGRRDEAIIQYQRALALREDSAEVHNNLGVALREDGQPAAALDHFRRALQLRNDFAEAWEGQGSCLREMGRPEQAVAAYRQAVALNPRLPGAWNNLGVTLKTLGRPGEAIEALSQALALDANLADAHNNLGITLKEQGRLSEGALHLRQAIALKPDFAEACNNLGLVCEIQGLVEEAIAAYRQALAINPALSRSHSNVLFALNYLPDADPGEIYAEHLAWAQRHADPLAALCRMGEAQRTHQTINADFQSDGCAIASPILHSARTNGEPDGKPLPLQGGGWEGEGVLDAARLRIGYVSPDLRMHPVAFFLEGVLEQHDRENFEIFCYADVSAPDATTTRLQALADHWCDSRALSDAALAERIRADGIDILVDLAGHTDGNRLLAFARRPAPVQASWIGYFNTTGMAAVDYFISDVHGSPVASEQFFREQLVRLPATRFCYRPPDAAPPVVAPPLLRNGYITFGCFNNLAKLNRQVVALWAEILRAVPTSRLRLKALALNDTAVAERYRRQFGEQGVAAERLVFSGFSAHTAMLGEYGEVDIALDPFPFTGGVSSCEALWMGVPLVTLAGRTLVGRQSAAMLENLGHPEWIADSGAAYRDIAVGLAADCARLAQLRVSQRETMRASPLCDGKAAARALEEAFCSMAKRQS